MRPRIENSIGDDAMEDCGFLKFTDNDLKSSFLQALATMRKHRLFCDVILNVGNADIHAHRNVLACVSPYLMELFSADQQTQNGSGDGSIPSYRLNGGMSKIALQILVDYAYTATLEIPDVLVKDVYLAAWKLRMDRVVSECAKHLIAELTPESCIETRSLPGITKNKAFVLEVDDFIAKQFAEVDQSPGFLQLPCVQIEVLYQTKQEMSLVTHSSLARLVLDWMKRQLSEESLSMPHLLERSHLLYLALDNSLQDCSDLPPGHESESELVQDYKRLVLKCPNNKTRRKCLAAPIRPRVLIYSRDIGGDREEVEGNFQPDWTVLGSTKVAENTFVSLVTLDGALTRISIQLRLNVPTSASPIHTPDALTFGPKSEDAADGPELFCEVATMSGPKCGLGVSELDGKLLVCGGYDRGECLRLVEAYCPDENVWIQRPSMIEARGRVQIAVIAGTTFAVGGSNGTTELDTVECLPEGASKWRKCCRLPLARSNAGVCALNGRVYCIGGWNGQSGIRQCDALDIDGDRWDSVSPLNTGRTQAGVSAFRGKLWAVGGSDAWNCLSSCEVYDPEVDQWSAAASLLTARRGCGLAEFKGRLYAIGGSDGSHSLSTTEIYDEENKVWIQGPNLTTPRSNVSVVVVKDKLYAVGGFSGKTFLNTIEYLDPNTNEWTTFVAQTGNGDAPPALESETNGRVEVTNGVNGHREVEDRLVIDESAVEKKLSIVLGYNSFAEAKSEAHNGDEIVSN
ncbi:influenza virus NS1A-binding protein-like isoform X2 [Phlebotomus argentipes]|uniref:influenza virus NS1A-binding protein-like isoform X2 n=1 Tax=Phlebotomus argentipes TaxID=94469 RepID=UPI0028931088|nr:influenza virus NS1A-binding protein-like isoform X2 [Phlebotomus argentipes]